LGPTGLQNWRRYEDRFAAVGLQPFPARKGSVAQPLPTRAVRLQNGNTLISDQFNHQVIEVGPSGDNVFSQGMIGVAGTGFNELNAPYDAKVIGDYTGLTPPF